MIAPELPPLDVAAVVWQIDQSVNDAATPMPRKTPEVSRSTPRPSPTAIPAAAPTSGWAAGRWDRFPSWVEQSARCIAKHESWNAGLWTAQNPVSTASGAFQFIDGTWRSVSARAGYGGYSKAKYAPPHVQAAVFAWTATHHGLSPWRGTHCPGT